MSKRSIFMDIPIKNELINLPYLVQQRIVKFADIEGKLVKTHVMGLATKKK